MSVIVLVLVGLYAAFTGVPAPEARNMRREHGAHGEHGQVRRTVFFMVVLFCSLNRVDYELIFDIRLSYACRLLRSTPNSILTAPAL